MRAFTLGLRTLAREWRSGELGVLLLALVVAVSALTGVGLLVDRVDRAMRLQASEVLGADLRLQSTNDIPAGYAQEAGRRGLATSRESGQISPGAGISRVTVGAPNAAVDTRTVPRSG